MSHIVAPDQMFTLLADLMVSLNFS